MALQAAWDVSFLAGVCRAAGASEGEGGAGWEKLVRRFLDLVRLPSHSALRFSSTLAYSSPLRTQAPSAPPHAPTTLSQSASHYLQRTQTLFSALLPPSTAIAVDDASASNTSWLPLGAPVSAGAGSEFKSLLGLVKPGPRLGLLPTKG